MRIYLILLISTGFSYAFAQSSAEIDAYRKGMDAYLKLDFANAFEHFSKSAESGDRESFTMLAYMALKGEAKGDASQLAQRAQHLGDAKAFYITAEYYRREAKDPTRVEDYFDEYREAVEAIRKMADGGDVFWSTRYAHCLTEGLGVEMDCEAACKYLRQAIEKDYPIAYHNYGVALLNGQGVPVDYEKSLAMFRIAQSRGLRASDNGIIEIACRYLYGSFNLKPDVHRAISLLEELANRNNASALRQLGGLYNPYWSDLDNYTYSTRQRVMSKPDYKDWNKSLNYYVRAIEQGDESGWSEAGLSILYKDNAEESQRYRDIAIKKGVPKNF